MLEDFQNCIHTWENSVGCMAGDLRVLAQDGVRHVEDDGVLGHLLENDPLVDQGPHHAAVVVVQLILVGMLLIPGVVNGCY